MFYIEENGKIILFNQSKGKLVDTIKFMPQYQHLEIKETDRPIIDFEFADTEEYKERKAKEERERLDSLTLTPSDVERALLKAKGWDFEDLKAFLKTKGYTDLQIKAIGVELRSNDFFRGAIMGEEPNTIRIVDTIGQLLGYTSDDMDYLFENKELPVLTELTEEPEPVEDDSDTDTDTEVDNDNINE